MGIFHPQKSIRTEIEKSSTYNCLLQFSMPSLKSLVEVFYFLSDARPIFFLWVGILIKHNVMIESHGSSIIYSVVVVL